MKNSTFLFFKFGGFLLVALLLALLIMYTPNNKTIEMEVETFVNGTIGLYEGDLPTNMVARAVINDKGRIIYGPILKGELPSATVGNKLKALSKNTNHLVWIDKPYDMIPSTVWVILEKSSCPDLEDCQLPEFIKMSR